jgi:beta-lactam-binding protein with PASTA domain
MVKQRKNKAAADTVAKLWNNYVVRNVILALAAFALLVGVTAFLLSVFTRHGQHRPVPDFLGLSLSDAQALAYHDRLRIEVADSIYMQGFTPGIILRQRPEPGTNVKEGRRIFVTTNAYTQKLVNVPYVVGFSLRQAKHLLDAQGLQVEKLVYVTDIATNNVLEQWMGARQVTKESALKAEIGTGITLRVGRTQNAAPVTVPNISGVTLHEARSRLLEVGFNPGRLTFDTGMDRNERSAARVWRQSPDPDTRAPLGTEVSFWLTLDNERLQSGMRTMTETSQLNRRRRAIADSLAAEGFPIELIETETERLLQ